LTIIRTVALLRTTSRIVANILHVKVVLYVEEIIRKISRRPSKEKVDHIFTVRQILEKCWEQNLFIDFQAAVTQYGER